MAMIKKPKLMAFIKGEKYSINTGESDYMTKTIYVAIVPIGYPGYPLIGYSSTLLPRI